MLRALLFPFACALLASAAVSASAVRDYPLNGFNQIEVKGADRVIVGVGQQFSVSATGEVADLERMKIDVVDGELRVDRSRKRNRLSRTVTVTVTLPKLEAVEVSGSGTIKVDDVQSETVKLNVSGSGTITAAGRTGTLALSLGGSGTINTLALESQTLDASLAGSGTIDATARGRAAISLTGSGIIKVSGTRQSSISARGSGIVRCG